MNKNDLKRIIYEGFQARVAQIATKRDTMQAELDKDIEALRKDYGLSPNTSVGIKDLASDAPLDPRANKPKRLGKINVAALEAASEKADDKPADSKKKIRRKRQPRKPGQPTITKILSDCLPEVVRTLGANGKEFTTRDAFNYMVKKGLPDKRIEFKHVSLQLGQNKTALGIKSESRKVTHPGSKIPVVTNFFSLSRRRKASK
jgi:hypothetical protein